MNNANNNVPPLEMIVDVRPVNQLGSAWVVSVCVEKTDKSLAIRQRYIDTYDDYKNIHGALGVFDGDKFTQQEKYWETSYDIMEVKSTDKIVTSIGELDHFSMFYNLYSPKSGYYRQYVYSNFCCATNGNLVLVDKNSKILANLTVQETMYNLWYGDSITKYGLRKLYDFNDKQRKHIIGFYNEFEHCRLEPDVMPAVVMQTEIHNNPLDWAPHHYHVVSMPQRPNVAKIDIVTPLIVLQKIEPGHVVLLKATNQDNKFELEKNLTLDYESRGINQKFGLAEHQAEILEQFKGMSERG